eukprot:TRINITY_DN717_c0_g1_i1.p1 TRINITY_DN717_c0_g1~~TRINITY_DN717_c0_g1_i1.p1  ORF type:complete len:666 (+),score=115.44 TRINITY_DN717_c0_g1_i1:64-2061(+)
MTDFDMHEIDMPAPKALRGNTDHQRNYGNDGNGSGAMHSAITVVQPVSGASAHVTGPLSLAGCKNLLIAVMGVALVALATSAGALFVKPVETLTTFGPPVMPPPPAQPLPPIVHDPPEAPYTPPPSTPRLIPSPPVPKPPSPCSPVARLTVPFFGSTGKVIGNLAHFGQPSENPRNYSVAAYLRFEGHGIFSRPGKVPYTYLAPLEDELYKGDLYNPLTPVDGCGNFEVDLSANDGDRLPWEGRSYSQMEADYALADLSLRMASEVWLCLIPPNVNMSDVILGYSFDGATHNTYGFVLPVDVARKINDHHGTNISSCIVAYRPSNMSNNATVFWSGYYWRVKDGGPTLRLSPGAPENLCTQRNVAVTADGELQLSYGRWSSDEQWYGSEVYSADRDFGYGEYVIQVHKNPATFDPRLVVGAFTWSNQPDQRDIQWPAQHYLWGGRAGSTDRDMDPAWMNPNREVDLFEISQWGNDPNYMPRPIRTTHFAIQHWRDVRNVYWLYVNNTWSEKNTYYMNLQPGFIHFKLLDGWVSLEEARALAPYRWEDVWSWDHYRNNTDGSKESEWMYRVLEYIPKDLGGEGVDFGWNLNHWNVKEDATTDGDTHTFVFHSFDYYPNEALHPQGTVATPNRPTANRTTAIAKYCHIMNPPQSDVRCAPVVYSLTD